MTINPGSLYAEPNALAPYYSRFRVSERLLLTGHSHQVWLRAGSMVHVFFPMEANPGLAELEAYLG